MDAQEIILKQLERERFAHSITRDTLRAMQCMLYLQAKKESEFPWWRRKLLAWLKVK